MYANRLAKILLVVAITIVSAKFVLAQPNQADSLEAVLQHHKADDTAKVNLLNRLAYLNISRNPKKQGEHATQAYNLSEKLGYLRGKAESLWLMGILYTNTNLPKAAEAVQQGLQLAEQIGDNVMIIRLLNVSATCLRRTNRSDSALAIYSKAIGIAEQSNNPAEGAKCLLNEAQIYSERGDFDHAIASLQKAQQVTPRGDNLLLCNIYSSIGVAHAKQDNYPAALEYFQKHLDVVEKMGDRTRVLAGLINIGNIYMSQGDFDKAEANSQRALQIAKDINDPRSHAACYISLGLLSKNKKNSHLALEYYRKAEEIGMRISDYTIATSALTNIGRTLNSLKEYEQAMIAFTKAMALAEKSNLQFQICDIQYGIALIYKSKKDYPAALDYAKRSLVLAQKMGILSNQKSTHGLLSDIYASTGSYRNAYEHHKIYKSLSDSLNSEANIKKITGLQYTYRYEKEKRAAELEQQKKDAVQESRRKLYITIIAVLFVAMVAGFALAKLIKNKNSQLERANTMLRDSNEEISAQKDHIDMQNQSISSSIDYAREIQSAMLPPATLIYSLFPQSFIFYKPLNIVSGDFYWLTKVGSKKICAIADSTGHGVPGAFMSMLGISLLNEVVSKLSETEIHTDLVMSILRERVVTALHQTLDFGTVKDGFEIALFIVDESQGSIEFTGAGMPLLVINNGEAHLVNGDNIPVGISSYRDPVFTRHILPFAQGDMIYTFTDGYVDQIGGDRGLKYLTKNFVKFLLQNHREPMQVQLNAIVQNMEEWRGKYKQIDDVLVLGVRL